MWWGLFLESINSRTTSSLKCDITLHTYKFSFYLPTYSDCLGRFVAWHFTPTHYVVPPLLSSRGYDTIKIK